MGARRSICSGAVSCCCAWAPIRRMRGALIAAAKNAGMPLNVVDIPNPGIAALYENRLVLVRPDGHVCWRADAVPPDPMRIVERVKGG